MRIQNNIPSLNSLNIYDLNNKRADTLMEKLASGYRINRAGDDAAGLAISEKMRAQIIGYMQSQRNIEDGVSLVRTAEGALQGLDDVLQRMRELSVQAGNDTNAISDRGAIQLELEALRSEIYDIVDGTNFNTKQLLSSASTVTLQTGGNQGDDITLSLSGIADQISSLVDISASSHASAGSSITAIDTMLNAVNTERAKLGAMENRLEHAYNSAAVAHENAASAESRIRDTDMAKTIMDLTKINILKSANVSMLANSFASPMNVLKLLSN